MEDCVVFTSGRVSSDYLQKIVHAEIGTVVSRAAVTDLAADLARRNKITLYGFVRKGKGNCYSKETFSGKGVSA